MRDNMAKMRKQQVKNSLMVMESKLGRISMDGSDHLTEGQLKKIIEMRFAILKIRKNLK